MTRTVPPITCAPGVQVTPEEVAGSHVFTGWWRQGDAFGPEITVNGVTVWAAHKWGKPVPEIKMLHVVVDAVDPDGNRLDGAALLRGETVDVTTIVRCQGERYVVLVEQPRVPVLHWRVVSNPSGVLDAGEATDTGSMRELDEELGGTGHIAWGPLINPLEVLLGIGLPTLVSPGGAWAPQAISLPPNATARLLMAEVEKFF